MTTPVVAHTRSELKAAREALSSRDVAVVMTMGALHDGHATLIRAARERHDHVIVTIFLNPLQFGPKEDLSRYPRTFDADMEICTRRRRTWCTPMAIPACEWRAVRWVRCSKASPGTGISMVC